MKNVPISNKPYVKIQSFIKNGLINVGLNAYALNINADVIIKHKFLFGLIYDVQLQKRLIINKCEIIDKIINK